MQRQNISSARPSLTGNALKIIAMITMFIDHLTYVLVEEIKLPGIYESFYGAKNTDYLMKDLKLWNNIDTIGRSIGRLAFPIFVFLLIEGFVHTSNVFKYALRLLIFAVISEIPYDLAFSAGKTFYDPSDQNVMFTLFLGLVMLIGFETVHDLVEGRIKNPRISLTVIVALQTLIFAATAAVSYFTHCNYDVMGISLICAVYFLRNKPKYIWIGAAVAMLLTLSISNIWYGELLGLVAFIFIACYNGERGNFRLKYFFYIFYPAHIMLLAIVRMLLS